jgi:hypothetical protein
MLRLSKGDPFILPPVAGAAPGTPWEWAWDRLEDIIGAGWDLLQAIGRMLAELLQGTWEWIGGAIRFVYEWLKDFQDWLWAELDLMWSDIRTYPQRAAEWLKARVEAIAEWLNQGTANAAGWVKDRVWDAINWLRERVWDLGTWLVTHIEGAAEWVKDRVWDATNWLRERVWDLGAWLRDRVIESAEWTTNHVLPPIMGAFDDIGDAFRDAGDVVRDALVGAALALAQTLGDAFRWPWEHIMEPFGDLIDRKIAIPGKLLRGEYSGFPDFLEDAMDPPILMLAGMAGLLVLVQVLGLAVGTAFDTFVTPMALPYQQATMARVGAALLTVGAVQDALNRGFIDEATADDHLARAGYSGQAKEALLELRMLLPSPSDLVRFGVREAFTPEIAERFGQYEDYPAGMTGPMALQGFSEDWSRAYWAAHWDLPSATMGFEMLHRGVIGEADLMLLLRALDVMPYWRDKLIQISYNPITRVDLRRLYKLKIITEAQVFQGYKDLGYNDERAGWLTEFTKQYANPDDASQLDDMADLAASTFRTAYRRGVISRDDALDRIVDAGYTEDVADFFLTLDDAQMALNPTTDAGVPIRDLTVPVIRDAYSEKLWTRERAQAELEALGYLPWEADLLLQLEDLAQQRELTGLHETVIKELYLANSIDRPEASRQLDALGVLPERRDLLLQRWDLSRATKDRRLTLAQLQTGFREGLLSDTQLLDEFAAMGYNDRDAKFLVDITDKEPASTERRLSASQLQRAYKAGLISDAQLLDQLLALGYTQDDAQLLVDMATPEPAAKERQLSAAQLAAGFRSGLVTAEELLTRLQAAGYAQADAEILRDIALQQMEPDARRLSVAQLKEAYKAELVDRPGLLVELLALGYTDRDAGWLQTIIAPEE